MTTLTLGRKSLFTIIHRLNGSSLGDSSTSVNEHFNHFYEKTTNCINLHFPKKKVSKSQLKLRSKPWINSYTQRLMNYRDKLFHAMNKNLATPSNKYLYHKFRNRVVSEQCQGKIYHSKIILKFIKPNMKMLWSDIKSTLNLNLTLGRLLVHIVFLYSF